MLLRKLLDALIHEPFVRILIVMLIIQFDFLSADFLFVMITGFRPIHVSDEHDEVLLTFAIDPRILDPFTLLVNFLELGRINFQATTELDNSRIMLRRLTVFLFLRGLITIFHIMLLIILFFVS